MTKAASLGQKAHRVIVLSGEIGSGKSTLRDGLVDRYGTPIKLDSRSKSYSIVAPGKVQVKYVTQSLPPSASLKTGKPVKVLMDRAGKHFLSGATFASQQNGCIRRSDALRSSTSCDLCESRLIDWLRDHRLSWYGGAHDEC